jgi:hypothetical protein
VVVLAPGGQSGNFWIRPRMSSCFCVMLSSRKKPCDGLIPRPRSPTEMSERSHSFRSYFWILTGDGPSPCDVQQAICTGFMQWLCMYLKFVEKWKYVFKYIEFRNAPFVFSHSIQFLLFTDCKCNEQQRQHNLHGHNFLFGKYIS